jgi:hypothetical protein
VARLSEQTLSEIGAFIAHGHGYFVAAQSADPLVRPLLQYYGVKSLAEAVIRASESYGGKPTRRSGHGLKVKNWSQVLEGENGDLLDLQVSTAPGTFHSLWNATRNTERALIHNHYDHYCLLQIEGSPTLQIDEKVTFSSKDILSRVPDLCEVYEESLDEFSACHPTYVEEFTGLQRDYVILPSRRGLISSDAVRTAFGFDSQLEIAEHDQHHLIGFVNNLEFSINTDVSPPSLRAYVPPVKNDAHGISYLVEPLPGAQVLSSLMLLYATSFFLGMLARYYPRSWTDLVYRRFGESYLPLISDALDTVQERFPQLALEELEQKHIGEEIYHYRPSSS